MITFVLPDLGEGLVEAEIVTWRVGPGDHVVADQPLVAVETDKAVVEIPSPRSGYIERLCAEEGAIVQVGEALVDFSGGEPQDPGAIVGRLEPRPVTSEAAAIDPVAAAGPRATPAVRSRARRLGVDLARVTGTGPGGTISGADVEAAAARAAESAPPVPDRPGIEPLRGVRRSMAVNMTRAGNQVVPATVHDVADIDDWEPSDDLMIRLVRAIGRACSTEPSLNMTFHGPDVGRSRNDTVDLGLAVDTDEGLFVPVLRDSAGRTGSDLRRELDRLKAAVESRSISPEDLRHPTITLSNFGAMGGRHGVMVVIPPQVAIIGAGRAHRTVVARDDHPEIRRVLPLSLTFDHRAVTGGEAARFLAGMITDLESPT
jgi:pyruvate dehydrogenase E2 component (dihydrolipoamide acetyltransferase)